MKHIYALGYYEARRFGTDLEDALENYRTHADLDHQYQYHIQAYIDGFNRGLEDRKEDEQEYEEAPHSEPSPIKPREPKEVKPRKGHEGRSMKEWMRDNREYVQTDERLQNPVGVIDGQWLFIKVAELKGVAYKADKRYIGSKVKRLNDTTAQCAVFNLGG